MSTVLSQKKHTNTTSVYEIENSIASFEIRVIFTSRVLRIPHPYVGLQTMPIVSQCTTSFYTSCILYLNARILCDHRLSPPREFHSWEFLKSNGKIARESLSNRFCSISRLPFPKMEKRRGKEIRTQSRERERERERAGRQWRDQGWFSNYDAVVRTPSA